MNKYEEEIRTIKAKIGLKAVCTLDTDAERQCVWDALERQTPKKPKNGTFCPVCGDATIIDGEYGWWLNYCYNCGQAICWGKR